MTSQTILENTKLPLRAWFLAAYRFNHRVQLDQGLDKASRCFVQTGRVTRDQLKGGELAMVY